MFAYLFFSNKMYKLIILTFLFFLQFLKLLVQWKIVKHKYSQKYVRFKYSIFG